MMDPCCDSRCANYPGGLDQICPLPKIVPRYCTIRILSFTIFFFTHGIWSFKHNTSDALESGSDALIYLKYREMIACFVYLH